MKAKTRRRLLKVGLFGGTFDPIHNGHLAVARAARDRFKLDRVYFIPCGRPPHKDRPGLSPFLHRFAMVSLACGGESRFIPSLAEAGADLRGRRRFYSAETVRRLRRQLGPRVKLYFLLGADAYAYLPTWKNFRQLLRLCDFIVAGRPGYDLKRLHRVLPDGLKAKRGSSARVAIHVNGCTIHFLPRVHVRVSATAIRRSARRGKRLTRQVPWLVEDYIRKMGLYTSAR